MQTVVDEQTGKAIGPSSPEEHTMPEMHFVDFYARMADGFHGEMIENQPGSRPRGAYTEGKPGAIRLMAVLLNPGQPHSLEISWQGTATGAELAKIAWDSSGWFLKGDYHSHTLATLRQDVSRLFGRPFHECIDTFMFTNLVRCTTINNQSPDAGSVAIGAEWLREEIDLWSPKKIVAYGNDVALGMLSHDIRVDALLPHPAARGEWLIPGRRQARLAEVQKHLGFK